MNADGEIELAKVVKRARDNDCNDGKPTGKRYQRRLLDAREY